MPDLKRMDNAPAAFLFKPELPSPCFVIDLELLRRNAAILASVQEGTGAKILLALKAFAAFSTFPLLSRTFTGPLWGTCASSLDEARLGKEEFGGEVHAFAAAWSKEEMSELVDYVDHLTFNSLAQWRLFKPLIAAANAKRENCIQCGFRLNPEHSEGAVAIYNPCSPGSRLGIRKKNLAMATDEDWQGISGLHFHTLCEQDADALDRTLAAFENKFGKWLPNCAWMNWGGGHHITRPGYNLELLKKLLLEWRQKYNCHIYLEPGEAVALNAGWLIATVLDIVEADQPIAILDTSAACHMPDVLEMPYRPNVWQIFEGEPCQCGNPGALAHTCRLAGKSCLAGDVIGEYSFSHELKIGDRLVFGDMAIYSMVKTTTFNGLRLPSIALFDKNNNFTIIREFSYGDFKWRLS